MEERSRKDGKGTGNIWLSNLTGSGDENPGRNPRFHRLLCFEQQLLMLIVLYSLAASNKSQVDDHSAEVGVDVIVFRSVFRAFDTKMSIKYRFNHFVKGFVTERVIKIVKPRLLIKTLFSFLDFDSAEMSAPLHILVTPFNSCSLALTSYWNA